MAKKASRRAAREERDEDEIEREDVDDGHAAPARRARAARADDHGHDDHGHDDHDHDHEDEEEDAYWWSPYGVMGGLVVIGVLGFFGAFNSIAAKVMGNPAPVAAAAAADTHAMPPPTPPSHATPPNPHAARPGMPGAAQGETYGAKHLLVMYKGSMRAPANITRTKEEAKKRAEEAQKKAKAPGAKFEDIVKEYSDEPGAGARGGDLGTFRKGSMVPQFQEAVEKMKVNDISGLVETPFGYHVILRTK